MTSYSGIIQTLLTVLFAASISFAPASAGNRDAAPSASTNAALKYKYIDPKTGYRMGHYRAPTPPSISGATRINTRDLAMLIKKPDVILVDVMAHYGAGWDPLTGQWLVSKPRFNIPGSTWLPDVGGGHLDRELEIYFRSNVQKLTQGDKKKPLVIYCQSDCWMSWNAVRRLLAWGYSSIYWYPEGSDGWVEANHNLVKATPIPLDIKE